MTLIAGCDTSTARIGWAAPDGACSSIVPRAGASDSARRLHQLAQGVENALRLRPPRPDLVAIEGYSLHSPGQVSKFRLGEIGGVVRLRLFELGIPFMEIPPKSLKRHATGNGNADKPRMLDAARELGAQVANHDEADAWLLRRMCRQAYHLDGGPRLDHELDSIANLVWPVL